MDDLISRQDAIEAIKQMQMPIMRSEDIGEQFVFRGMSEALNGIKELPSVQPRKGKWINIQHSVTGDSNAECDQCGAIVHDNFLLSPINFCPNCGAYMRGEQE